MTSPEGGFYSATDADSLNPEGHAEEGWFFTWTPAEIRAALGEDRAKIVESHWGVSEAGNFEGRNILHLSRGAETIARVEEIPLETVERALTEAREALYEVRQGRPAPLLDDKILTAWNGLMISAFARAGLALGDEGLIRTGARAADFILTRMRKDGRLYRSFRNGRPEHPAFVEDYAFLVAAMLDLYEADPDTRWLREAIALQEVLDDHYADAKAGGYFTTADDHEKLIAREKPGYDGAEPTGNSVAALNLLRLHELTSREAYREAADRTLAAFDDTLAHSPAALSEMLLALDFRLDTPKEIVLVRPAPEADLAPMLEALTRSFLPNRVLAVVSEGQELDEHAELAPLLKGRVARKGRVTAFVCENRICKLPTTDPEELGRQIAEVRPLFEEGEKAGE
jgi:uncharacterized protein YyaL (SSP411 family)